MHRGDIVICALAGDYGKPRPAVIAQSDLFNATHASIVVCPITSFIINAPFFRINIIPNLINNLSYDSQIMVDKLTAIKADKITQQIGKLTQEEIVSFNNAIKLWLNI